MNNLYRLGLTFIMVLTLSVPPVFAEDFYRYRDENGILHFTDNLNDIPEDQREKLTRYKKKQTVVRTQLPAVSTEETTPDPKGFKALNQDDQLRMLNDEKRELESLYGALMEKMQSLEKEKSKVKTAETSAQYEQKVSDLNKEITAYEERRASFDRKLKHYKQNTSK